MKKNITCLTIVLLLSGCASNSPQKVNNGISVENNHFFRYETPYKNGKIDGIQKWWSHGNDYGTQTYKNGKKEGPSIRYHKSGKIATTANYVNDELEGLWKEWYENGQMKELRFYSKGKRIGKSTGWHLDGKKRFISNYVDGKLEGEDIQWWENGKILSKTQFHNGKEYGMSKKYYDNGNLEQQVPLIDGSPNGTAKYYNRDGTLSETGYWVDGAVKSSKLSASEQAKNAQREKEFMDRMRKENESKRISDAASVALSCTDSGVLSSSEMASEASIGQGKGEGAALGYMMSHGNTTSTSKEVANNYCITNANEGSYNCVVANAYVQGCMSKFGY